MKKRKTEAPSFSLLKFTQARGFEPITLTGKNAWNDEDESAWLKRFGFGADEEGEGHVGHVTSRHEWGVAHHYADDGRRLTVVEGATRCEYILTDTPADHMALRIALSPLAVALAIDAFMYDRCREKWERERARGRR